MTKLGRNPLMRRLHSWEIANIVRELREVRFWTQRDLAIEANVYPGAVERIEQGLEVADIRLLEGVAVALNLHAYFFTDHQFIPNTAAIQVKIESEKQKILSALDLSYGRSPRPNGNLTASTNSKFVI